MTIIIEQAADVELVGLACKGDERAFEEIVRRHNPRVFHIVSRFFRDRNLVEEVAQEVFLKAYTQLSSFTARGSFQGWLSRIATTICLNTLRSEKRQPGSNAMDLSAEENGWLESKLYDIAAERHRAIEHGLLAADITERVLKRMSPEDRLVLTLIDGEELSTREVAEMTGWSLAKIKIQAFRARQRMRKEVESLLAINTTTQGQNLISKDKEN